MKMQREEQKIHTQYKTAKGRTENMTPCTLKGKKKKKKKDFDPNYCKLLDAIYNNPV